MSNIREVQFDREAPIPDPDVILMLEFWLERARSGELIGCAICGVTKDRGISTEFNSGSSSFVMQAAVSTLHHRFMTYMHER